MEQRNVGADFQVALHRVGQRGLEPPVYRARLQVGPQPVAEQQREMLVGGPASPYVQVDISCGVLPAPPVSFRPEFGITVVAFRHMVALVRQPLVADLGQWLGEECSRLVQVTVRQLQVEDRLAAMLGTAVLSM
jgi:hypothetical protein